MHQAAAVPIITAARTAVAAPNGYGHGPAVVVGVPVIGTYYGGRGYWDGHRYWGHRERWNGGWRYR